MAKVFQAILLVFLVSSVTGNSLNAAIKDPSSKKSKRKASKKASSSKHVKIKKEWHYLVGWGNNALVTGAGYTVDLSRGGTWRFETSFHTAVGDETLGSRINSYSFNGLLTLNLDLFQRLRLTLKGGPAIRHTGLGVDAVNEYYNYGATIALDLDKRGSYGIFYYPDLIGLSYISRF